PPSTLNSQPPVLAAPPRLRFGALAGHDEQNLPGRGGGAVSLGAAPVALLTELHHLLRQPALVCALSVRARADRRSGRGLLGAVQRNRFDDLQTGGPLFERVVHLLSGVSWRTLPAPARSTPSDRLLSGDRRRRRVG